MNSTLPPHSCTVFFCFFKILCTDYKEHIPKAERKKERERERERKKERGREVGGWG